MRSRNSLGVCQGRFKIFGFVVVGSNVCVHRGFGGYTYKSPLIIFEWLAHCVVVLRSRLVLSALLQLFCTFNATPLLVWLYLALKMVNCGFTFFFFAEGYVAGL